jgi:hypothetical protein
VESVRLPTRLERDAKDLIFNEVATACVGHPVVGMFDFAVLTVGSPTGSARECSYSPPLPTGPDMSRDCPPIRLCFSYFFSFVFFLCFFLYNCYCDVAPDLDPTSNGVILFFSYLLLYFSY